jgi:saccharopine dehydrogenase (NAD+, L-lysine forming)
LTTSALRADKGRGASVAPSFVIQNPLKGGEASMAKVLIIGAGGVGRVVAHKVASVPDVFTDILLASRTLSKCEVIASAVGGGRMGTARVNADDRGELVQMFKRFRPEIVMNVALPYQDLTIMDACLETGVHYLDTANYEPPDVAKFEYHWQWAYADRFRKAGLTAILGCGFDPGVTGVFTAYAAKHHFDRMLELDIVDCNAGDHGRPFATNFNPEINIREVTQKGKYWDNGRWIETEPHAVHQALTYPEIGPRESYLIYHEELESLVKHFPTLRRARFWMTFGQEYLTHLRVIQNIGMASIKPILFEGREIVPIQFLKAVLPDPGELGEHYSGETSIGCRIRGMKNGAEKTVYIYNNCKHQDAFRETGTQGVSYTTGVPAMIGAMMFVTGKWRKPGVFNVEEFDPDPFMEQLNLHGLPWHELHDVNLEV